MTTDLTQLTIAAARAGLADKQFSAAELTEAHLAQMECHRALNAFVTETAEHALSAAKASDARIAKGEAAALEGIPLGIKDLFATKGIATTAGSKILEGFVPPYESTVTAKLWQAGCRLSGQDQSRRIRDGLGQPAQCVRAGDQSLDQARRRQEAGAGWQFRRLGGSGRGAALPGCDRHRHGGLDPPAGGVHRDLRDQADLWALLALRHRGLRLVARSGRRLRPHGRRLRDPAASHGRPRSERQHVGRSGGTGLAGCGRRVGRGPADRHSQGVPRRRPIARDRPAVAARGGLAAGPGRRRARGLVAAQQVRTAGLLHHCARGSLVQPRPLRRDALRAARRGTQPRRHVREVALRRLRRRGQAPDHDRHLRPLRRLLRRLLREGAEGPAHPGGRLRESVR